jgi:Transposase
MAQKVVNAGIDVSKICLDVALWPTRLRLHVAYDEAGLAALAAWLTAHAVQRVGLEASGGYERHAIEALEAAGFEVARLNPLYVRPFAQAKGRLAKNDRVDALVVAHFTAAMIEEIPARRPAALGSAGGSATGGEFTSVDDAARQLIDERIAERMIEEDGLAWARPMVDQARAAVARGEVMALASHKTRMKAVLAKRTG